jgi:hypothetical protein
MLGDEDSREAAELVAFRVLDPALRSRGVVTQAARRLANDPSFTGQVEALLREEPAGVYQPPRLSDLAERVARIEARLGKLGSP